MSSLASENKARDLFLSGGDLRQLFARDRRRADGEPLVYLPDGEAARFKADCAAEHLICPVADCPRPQYVAVGGTGGRRHHFRHRGTGTGGHSKERWFHLVGKQLLADWARTAIPGTTTALEVSLPGIDRRADALATTPDGRRFALEVQYAGLDFVEWEQRDNDYRSIGITPIWVFGHLRPHLVPGRGYVEPGEVKVTVLFEQIIAAGRGPIHLVNPDTRQIAQLLPWVDARAVRSLDDDETPLPYAPTNAVLGVAALHDCALSSIGLRSPWGDRVDAGRRRVLQQAEQEKARDQARQEAEERAAAARKAAFERRAVAEAQAAKRAREQRAADKARVISKATAGRNRVQNPDHLAVAAGGPRLGDVPSQAWRLVIYLETVHGRVGQDIRALDIYGSARRALRGADRRSRATAITDWIFELRALRLVDFASLGRAIVGPIRVMGDIDHPAPSEGVQRRRAMDVHIEDDEYVAIDRERSVLFIVSRRGAIISRRRINTTAPAPSPPPRPQRASDAEWKAARRAERAAHVPAWVAERLPTDERVTCAPVDWHGAIWDQHIRDQVGAEKPWGLLMATLVTYGARRDVLTEDALLGFLAHLQRNRAVKFETVRGRPPEKITVTSGAVASPIDLTPADSPVTTERGVYEIVRLSPIWPSTA